MTADILGAAQLAASEAEVRALRAELDETNRGLLAVYAELQDAHQRIADLVAMLSHEIRQPLGVLGNRRHSRGRIDEVDGGRPGRTRRHRRRNTTASSSCRRPIGTSAKPSIHMSQ